MEIIGIEVPDPTAPTARKVWADRLGADAGPSANALYQFDGIAADDAADGVAEGANGGEGGERVGIKIGELETGFSGRSPVSVQMTLLLRNCVANASAGAVIAGNKRPCITISPAMRRMII